MNLIARAVSTARRQRQFLVAETFSNMEAAFSSALAPKRTTAVKLGLGAAVIEMVNPHCEHCWLV